MMNGERGEENTLRFPKITADSRIAGCIREFSRALYLPYYLLCLPLRLDLLSRFLYCGVSVYPRDPPVRVEL